MALNSRHDVLRRSLASHAALVGCWLPARLRGGWSHVGTSKRATPKIFVLSNPVVGLRGGFNNRQNFVRVKTDGAGEDDQFDDVDTALTALNARHEGLMALEPVRQVFLTETRLDASIDQRPAKRHLSRASDCFCHASHTFCDVASG